MVRSSPFLQIRKLSLKEASNQPTHMQSTSTRAEIQNQVSLCLHYTTVFLSLTLEGTSLLFLGRTQPRSLHVKIPHSDLAVLQKVKHGITL